MPGKGQGLRGGIRVEGGADVVAFCTRHKTQDETLSGSCTNPKHGNPKQTPGFAGHPELHTLAGAGDFLVPCGGPERRGAAAGGAGDQDHRSADPPLPDCREGKAVT